MPSETQDPVGVDPRLPPLANSPPLGLPIRTSTASASGAVQLILVIPKDAEAATGAGFGLAVRVGPRAGQGALTDVRQTLLWNVFESEPERFRMSEKLVVA